MRRSLVERPRTLRGLTRAALVASLVVASLVVASLVGASVASAGAVTDADNDLVPDSFDNCRTHANGPNQLTNQVDADLDGYGNRCDADCDQSGTTTTADFGCFLPCFGLTVGGGPGCLLLDFDGSGTVTTADFGIFLSKFAAPIGTPGNAPGPSGLVCANPFRNAASGDPICTP